MQKLSTFILLFFFATSLVVAQGRFPTLDKSSMDMSYYPVNYPILKIQDKAYEPLVARVLYSRPQRNGRNVFGELLEYNKVWRLGANEATEIEFYKDVTVNSKLIPKGRYTLYALPSIDKWIIMINKETDIWGAFKYDSAKDIAKIELAVQKLVDPIEAFSLFFEKVSSTDFVLVAAWENMSVTMPIKIYNKPVIVKKPIKKK